MLLAPSPLPRRLRLLVRPVGASAWAVIAVAHRLLALVLWPLAWVTVLLLGRAPAWWRLVVGQRSAPPVALARGPVARLALTWPWWALLRYETWVFTAGLGLVSWLCGVTVGRVPARLRRRHDALRAFGRRVDRYAALVSADRPRVPEPDARYRADRDPAPDVPRLPGWSPGLGWASAGIDLAIGVGASIAIVLPAWLLTGDPDDVPVGLALIGDLVIQLGPPAVGLTLAARQRALHPAQFGLHVLRPLRSLVQGGGLIAGYAVVFTSLLVPFLAVADTGDGNGLVPAGAGAAWTLVFVALATVIAPIFEEVFYRGLLFQALRGRGGTWPAAFASSCLFALAHLDLDPVAFVDRALIGLGLCWLFARTGRLLPGMFAHSMNNAIVVPLTLGWTWQIPFVVAGSLALITLLVVPISRRGARDFQPVPWQDRLASRPELPG